MGQFLDDAQRARFRADGFLCLPGFVDAERCLVLRQRAVDLAATLARRDGPLTVFTADGTSQHGADDYFLSSGEAIRCFFERDALDETGRLRAAPEDCVNKLGHALHDLDPVFDAFSRTPQLAAVAADIGMQDPRLLQSMYIFKQPHIGGEVACHTDHTYLWTEPRSATGFWFAIDDATLANGCLEALPGGHRLPVKCRSRLNAAGTATELMVFDPSPYPDEGLVALEVPRGALVLLDGALPHRSGANRSDRPRHAYTIHAIEGSSRYLPDNWLRRTRLPMTGFAAVRASGSDP